MFDSGQAWARGAGGHVNCLKTKTVVAQGVASRWPLTGDLQFGGQHGWECADWGRDRVVCGCENPSVY